MIRFILLLSVFLLLSCGNSDVADSGSGTGTGNPYIIGIATTSDGTPLANCPIKVFSEETSNQGKYLGEGFDENGIAHTDSHGSYHFKLTQTGSYRVEVISCYEDEAISFPLAIETLDTTVNTETIELAPLDTLRGKVILSGSDDSESVRVGVKESDRNVTVTNGSEFALALPQGIYSVTFKPEDDDDYEDTVITNVSSNSDLGSILLLSEELNYSSDTAIVRTILDMNGLTATSAVSVTSRYLLTGRVKELDLESHHIDTIPPIIGKISRLRELDVKNTNVRSLPGSIANLSALRELELINNNLTSLPKEFAKLSELNQLNLSGNNLSSLPAELKSWADRFDSDWASTQKSD